MTLSNETAKSGHPVLFLDGRATASMVSPEREGLQWAQAQLSAMKSLSPGETIVVLGLGSGYHVHALRMLLPSHPIVAVDVDARTIAFNQDRFTDITTVAVDSSLGPDAMMQMPWAQCLGGAFTFLRHKASFLRSTAEFRLVESWLVGRAVVPFLLQLNMRPEVEGALDIEKIERLQEKGPSALLSIRDLKSLWNTSAETSQARRVFRVLEELVK